MWRRTCNITAGPLKGGPRPWKKRNTPIAIHPPQRPQEDSEVDFSSLGLQFPLQHSTEFTIRRIGWSAPPAVAPTLPFIIDRTNVGNQLPVYTEYKAGRTKVVTIVRKIRGDVHSLKADMEKVVGKPVTITPGKLQVVGNFHFRLKKWLAGLGF